MSLYKLRLLWYNFTTFLSDQQYRGGAINHEKRGDTRGVFRGVLRVLKHPPQPQAQY